ncbi:MAG: aspartate kinase [Ignavibacteriaceae bacterium]|jgi:aspartate kinase
MKIVVQKFGGSSVADTDKIKRIAEKIQKRVLQGNKLVVVVSAMGKTTDNLLKLAKEISTKPDPRELDMLLTTGEQISISLLAIALNQLNIRSKSLNAFQAEIMTTGDFNEARIKNIKSQKIFDLLEDFDVITIAGFQGINEEGDLTTLGRGGSDTSAVALAAALQAPCEIYSDVDGIYTCDPRLHPNAKKLAYVTYDEMLEMASLGAKVLHSRSVEIAKKFEITLYCAATFSEVEGTYIVKENIEQPVVTGLSVLDNQTQVTLSRLPEDYTLIHEIFHNVAEEGLNVDMISVIDDDSGLTVSFTIVDESKEDVETALHHSLKDLEKWNISYHPGYSKLSIVGVGMRSSSGVASKFFGALQHIPIKLVTTSEIKISCLIETSFKQHAVESLTKAFDL